MEFVRITEHPEIKIKDKTETIEDYQRGINYLSNFYAVCDEDNQGFARLRNSPELLLLNTKDKTFGVSDFNISCKLAPNASSQEIIGLLNNFEYIYNSRN